jgi:hypothetical protein
LRERDGDFFHWQPANQRHFHRLRFGMHPGTGEYGWRIRPVGRCRCEIRSPGGFQRVGPHLQLRWRNQWQWRGNRSRRL